MGEGGVYPFPGDFLVVFTSLRGAPFWCHFESVVSLSGPRLHVFNAGNYQDIMEARGSFYCTCFWAFAVRIGSTVD